MNDQPVARGRTLPFRPKGAWLSVLRVMLSKGANVSTSPR
jgi:hypothetical protein